DIACRAGAAIEALDADFGADQHKLETRIDPEVGADADLATADGALLPDAIDPGIESVPVESRTRDRQRGTARSEQIRRVRRDRHRGDQSRQDQLVDESHPESFTSTLPTTPRCLRRFPSRKWRRTGTFQ